MSTSLSRHWRIRFQLVLRADSLEAIVELAMRLSKATMAEEGGGWRVDDLSVSETVVLGLAGWEIVALLPSIWKEGRDKLSISTGVSLVRSILCSCSTGRHHSKSRSWRSAFKLIPSWEIGCWSFSSHPISFASVIASGMNQQKTASPCSCCRYFGRYLANSCALIWYLARKTNEKPPPFQLQSTKRRRCLPSSAFTAINMVWSIAFSKETSGWSKDQIFDKKCFTMAFWANWCWAQAWLMSSWSLCGVLYVKTGTKRKGRLVYALSMGDFKAFLRRDFIQSAIEVSTSTWTAYKPCWSS